MSANNAIVLDLDGPLLSGIHRHYECYRDILTESGFSPIAISEYWELKRERRDRRELLSKSHALGLYDQFLAQWMERIEDRKYLALDQVQSGVFDVLERWRDLGVHLVLATMRNNPDGVHWQLDRFGLSRYLDDILISGTRRGFEGKVSAVAANLRTRTPGLVAWIGDTEADLYAARQIGAKVCLLSCGLRTERFLNSLGPDAIMRDLGEFASSELPNAWLFPSGVNK